jgi:hypothetical protein
VKAIIILAKNMWTELEGEDKVKSSFAEYFKMIFTRDFLPLS